MQRDAPYDLILLVGFYDILWLNKVLRDNTVTKAYFNPRVLYII